jgi:hypothetical protein
MERRVRWVARMLGAAPVPIGAVLMGALLVSACDAGGAAGSADGGVFTFASTADDPPTLQGPPVIVAREDLVAGFDPELPGFESVSLAFDVLGASGTTCTIGVERDEVVLRSLAGTLADGTCEARWDGRDEVGAVVDPGLVQVVGALSGRGEPVTAEASVEVLRLGLRAVQLEGEGRAPLLYRAANGVTYGYVQVPVTTPPWRLGPDASEGPSATALELPDGTPRPLPMPWDDLVSPPLDLGSSDGLERDTHNLPTAWVAGSIPDVEVTFTTAWIGGVADPLEVEVRAIAPEGFTGESELEVLDGASARFVGSRTWAPAVGRYEESFELRFEARRPGGPWIAVPGALTTTHRVYGLVAAPSFDRTDAPHRPWVDVVDRVAGWVDGTSADPDEVASRIVEGVFYELGLQYDNVRGASFYTSYPSFSSFRGAVFNLSRFQERDNGNTINCSDAASIVSSYANMMGIDLRYRILQNRFEGGFDLNYLYAIGRGGFAPSPFLSGRSAFNYHAITAVPDTRVFDATLAVDGDGMPGSAPHTTLLVQGLAETDYLVALSPEWMNVNVSLNEKVRLR